MFYQSKCILLLLLKLLSVSLIYRTIFSITPGIVSKNSDLHRGDSFTTFSKKFVNSDVLSANCTPFVLIFWWITYTEMKNFLFIGTKELHSKFATVPMVCQSDVIVERLKTCLSFALDEMLHCGYFQRPFLEGFSF